MCGIKKERETRQPGRGDKEEEEGEGGLFHSTGREKRMEGKREKEKEREQRQRKTREGYILGQAS